MAKTQRKIDVRQELAEKLMQQMETGSAFWQKPWDAGSMEMPHNATTGKPYKGVNAQYLMLFSPDPADNRWCTYKQANEQGWQVKKGEHGIPIEKWSEYTHKRTADEIQKLREAGAVGLIESEEKRLGVRYYTVFHASQIDGIPDRERGPEISDRNNAVDPRLPMLAEAMGVDVQHSGSRAFYRPSQDRVNLPPVETFQTGRDHDTIFLHELSHSTGHPERMHRDLSGKFGSQKYAKEELRAELSAAMTALSLGMGFSPEAQQQEEGREVVAGVENTAAYLNSWLKGLPEKDRQKELMSAITDAQKISDYLIERTPEIEKGLDQELVGFVRGVTQDAQDNHIECIREAAKLDPEKASRWAEALRSNPHEYAKEANPDLLHADNMVGIATQLEIGAQEIEQKQEHKMATDKYFVLDEHTLGFIRPDEKGVLLAKMPPEAVLAREDDTMVAVPMAPDSMKGLKIHAEVHLKADEIGVYQRSETMEKDIEPKQYPRLDGHLKEPDGTWRSVGFYVDKDNQPRAVVAIENKDAGLLEKHSMTFKEKVSEQTKKPFLVGSAERENGTKLFVTIHRAEKGPDQWVYANFAEKTGQDWQQIKGRGGTLKPNKALQDRGDDRTTNFIKDKLGVDVMAKAQEPSKARSAEKELTL